MVQKKKKHIRNPDEVLKLSYDWILNYKNDNHTPKVIYDGIGRKERTIIVPSFRELVVQHAVVQVMKPIFMKGMYEHSYASIPGRGSHKGKKVIEKWIHNDRKNTKYVLKMDIRHFFDTIPHDILKHKFQKVIRDKELLRLLNEIIDVSTVGLPLGFYTSQWFSNWYLQGLDHYIKETLKAKHYIRYMDDMVIYGSNKRNLHKIRLAISQYLESELGLELKSNWQVYRFHYKRNQKEYGRDLDFMGFRFFRKKTILRKRIMLKASRKAKRIHAKDRMTIHDARQMTSYLGWIDCTDTYNMYLIRIKPYISFKSCKKRISTYDRQQKLKGGNK